MGRFAYLLPFAAFLSAAADSPTWTAKPVSDWSNADAQVVLDQSPWAKSVPLRQVRNLSKAERRDGGDWEAGIGPTVGLDGLGIFGPTLADAAIARVHQKPNLGNVMVRWESSLPIRAAQTRLGLRDALAAPEAYYAIAVYDVLTPTRWGTANELKGVSYLRREKKKDIKPVHVEIMRHDDGFATVVYLFPRTSEITSKDKTLEFVAQIGRLFIAEYFFTDDMQYQGRLEL